MRTMKIYNLMHKYIYISFPAFSVKKPLILLKKKLKKIIKKQ